MTPKVLAALSVLSMALVIPGSAAAQQADAQNSERCAETATRNATLAVENATHVHIIARAGALSVTGRPSLSDVSIAGTACATSQIALERVELVTSRTGDGLLIEARTPDKDSALALVIELPDSLLVNIDDTSGPLQVHGVAAVTITDGSGSLQIDQIAGDVQVTDGSGSLQIDQIAGDVQVTDGSGSISIHDVDGNVTVDEDGAGSIGIADVGQDVVIGADGSGSIRVSDVGGDFTVRRDGSGGIRYDNVGGQVSTPAN